MTAAHVAQVNIGTMVAPTDDPAVAEFMDNLDRINAIADDAPGFVWRLQTDEGNATDIHVFPNPLELVNMSIWQTVDELKAYVYRSEHVEFFRRRAEWFEADAKRVALWHVAVGEIAELDDAIRRVEFLERSGPSAYAFGFARPPAPLLFEETDLDDPDTMALVERLNEELAAVATEPGENHFSLTTAEVTGDAGRMVRARLDGHLVGCGAIRRIEPHVGELKRMFVDPDARGRRVGAALLDQLELRATRLGLDQLKLETGPRQVAARALYERSGYARCPAWGEYLDSPATSMCYAKSL
ncbi:acetyltransferase (GNAT) family protein [Ilumatobacter fluminis]|uniref:Acetyltransferase (GNAT) family protein n=1 Tax=Ilumatobacter fluminis TaxID=467091 RepID=A0A4V3EJ44_9ACTN|nr:GNAT family N-acetyltransferase [Ilumatobacter fluminis]TDT16908.1 acetyltransferase (GNAT) family protein [Ilumatobacter fluminis]